MKDMKYVVISMENQCIFTYTTSKHIANAICSGLGDTLMLGMSKVTNKWYPNIKDKDMFYQKVIMLDAKNRTMKVMPAETVSDTWRETQDLVRLRQRAFYAWESATSSALSKVERNQWEYFDTVCEQELAKCNPDANEYSWMIEEYARTVEQPVEHAYKNLKMRIESDNVAKFRIQALAEKWMNKFNQMYTKEEIDAGIKEMVREYWLNSKI